jgi:preprotein translocase subunit YajC
MLLRQAKAKQQMASLLINSRLKSSELLYVSLVARIHKVKQTTASIKTDKALVVSDAQRNLGKNVDFWALIMRHKY